MEDFVLYNSLYDIYKELLTEKEREVFIDYYQEDLSLSEIAINNHVSKTAISKTLKKVLDKLSYYEELLQIYKKDNLLKEILNSDNIDDIKKSVRKVIEM